MTPPTFYDLPTVSAERAQAGILYNEFIRVPLLSVGVYVLPAGGTDPQKPHREDEVYYVVRGRARMRVGSEEQVVKAGSVIFVAEKSSTGSSISARNWRCWSSSRLLKHRSWRPPR